MLNSKKFLLSIFISIISVFAFIQCSDTGINSINVFSINDDIQLGTQLDQQIRAKSQEYPILNDAQATAYVQDIINQIINAPDIKYKGQFPYKVTLLNSNTINAFCTPGGYIYVYKGLLKFVDNEATLAAVLAHEVTHAERRHATNRMTKEYGLQMLLSVVLGNSPSTLESIGANLFSGLTLMYNSREDEYEADEYSFKYLQSTIWYPGAGKFFFDKMSSQSSNSNLEELFSTHPLDQKRIEALDKLIKDANLQAPSESNLFGVRYLQFRGKLN